MESIKFPGEKIEKMLGFNEADKFEIRCSKCHYWVGVKKNLTGYAPCVNALPIMFNGHMSDIHEIHTREDFGCNYFKKEMS